VSTRRRARFVALADLLARHHPALDLDVVRVGRVLVDGRVLTNPRAMVRADASIRVVPDRRLRGAVKLAAALDAFAVDVTGQIAVDVGASAGGFTTALLERGASRVYAVDAGVGQLVGRLRRDTRVVNLEGHNLGALDRVLVPDPVDVVTMDLSYLSLHDAVPQLDRLEIGPSAVLIVLVKPTFELGRATLAATDTDVTAAVERAADGITASGWTVIATCPAPRTGRRGAREVFMCSIRSRPDLTGGA
jgi:23S rRNA (cytidine1920-2'-O)/16S rRNA (cytidine1409-2'-O)-methyltransferase